MAVSVGSLERRTLLSSVGPDGFGYEAFDHPFDSSINLTPGGPGVATVLSNSDDAAEVIHLGDNTFYFYGIDYSGFNQLRISTNGLITFDAAELEYENSGLTSVPSGPAIAPLWDDWVTNSSAADSVLYRFDDLDANGTSDRLVIEWNQVPHYRFAGPTQPATFQAILQLNNPTGQSEIIFNYPDLDVGDAEFNNGASATVGIKATGTQGVKRLVISQNNGSGPFVGTGKAIRIVQNPNYGTVSGNVYNDLDDDGLKDVGEPPLVDWTIYDDADGDGALDPQERSALTDASGKYFLGGLLPGPHTLRMVLKSGYEVTAPAGGVQVVNLSAGQALSGVNFGARGLPGEIRGSKWHDLNGNSIRDGGEPGLSGWTIYLDADRDNVLDAGEISTTTNANGDYAFLNVTPGVYVVTEVQQAGWQQAFPGGGGGGGGGRLAGANLAAAVLPGQSDATRGAVARAADLEAYTAAQLASAIDWVVGLKPGRNVRDVAGVLGSRSTTAAPRLADTYVLRLGAGAGGKVAAKLKGRADVAFFYPLVSRQQSKRGFVSNDPLFPSQWHLKNTGQTGGTPNSDANVQPAWDNDFTGNGNTVIGVVDDGLQYTHPDLAANYQSAYSFDFNEGDSDPAPDSNDDHGTAVAGVAAGRGGNGVGVTGAAPLAGLAGLRLIAGPTNDAQEATALTYQKQNVDIYSNSWGPFDGGDSLDSPGPLTLAALADGATTGRGGLGNIYTWAAGNGLQNNDNVNYDGYANNRYTIAVSAIDHNGRQSSYSEPGAAILVAAYSNGSGVGITTTDLVGADGYNGLPDQNYTNGFGGTSSATPLVSGVIAQMLHANPNLTWRDVQHILVRSARKNDATDAGWRLNGAGHDVSHKYGFGAIDSGAAVALAQTWQTAGPEISATSGVVNVNTAVPDGSMTGITSSTLINDAIRTEKVEVVLSAAHAGRGDLRVVLTSPNGTQSVLAEPRNDIGDNYTSWVFSSSHHWDEVSQGTWTLKVTDENGNNVTGTFSNWKLNIYGTQADPTVHYVTLGNGQIRTGIDFGNRDLAAPTVTNVFVSSTAWNAGFLGFLAASGQGDAAYGFPIRANEQTDELPWTNLNRVSIRFSENVNVAADDLVVRGVTNAVYPLAASGGFFYNAATFTATWTLATSGVVNDKLVLDLDADLGTGVTDVSGKSLDGEWTNPIAPAISADTFPSGDGTGGGDFKFRVNVLPGDVDRSGGAVVASDVTLVRNAQGFSPGAGQYTLFRDVNGTASILGNDLTLTRNHVGQTLPFGEPTLLVASQVARVDADRFEPNDSFFEAADLGTLTDRTEAGLTILASNNQDFYLFTAAVSGVYTVDLLFKHQQGDIDATLYGDSQFDTITFSQSEDDDEQLIAFLDGGKTYVIQAFGFGGAVNPDYDLVIHGPEADNVAPVVTDVFVSGSNWNASFLNFLETSGAGEAAFGYRLQATEHADELPWTNINRISIRFSEDVIVAADDLVVRGVTNATYPLAASGPFAYDPVTFTATWHLETTGIPNDKLVLDLDADAGTGVTDANFNQLDGEWINPTAPAAGGADTFPTGDGIAGGDFKFRINVLPGDANRNGSVGGTDVALVRNNQGFAPGTAGYSIFRDVNGTASILGSDVTLVRNRQATTLPAGEPSLLVARSALSPFGRRTRRDYDELLSL